MSNLLKAEFYKLFHSWYFWGIGLFNLLLSSVLLLDSVGGNIQPFLCFDIQYANPIFPHNHLFCPVCWK
mgnify:FL=1